MDDSDDDRLEIVARPGFRRREVTVGGGCRLDVVEDDWRGALVVVERGEIDLCTPHGGRRRFASGALLFLDGLRVAVLHNPGVDDAVLVAHSRAPA